MEAGEPTSTADVCEVDGADSAVIVHVVFAAGGSYECRVAPSDTLRQLREATEQQHQTPPATFLKLAQGARVLLDDEPVSVVDVTQPVFAIVTRETRLEVLLQACGGYGGYAALLSGGAQASPGRSISIGPFPTILEVLEDMAGQPAEMEHLKAGGAEGVLEFSGRSGDLLLPSLGCGPVAASMGFDTVPRVTMSIGLNSDLYNNGLGVWLETSPLLDRTVDERGIPTYVYSTYGMDSTRPGNTVKFHPGMGGGQLRVEGVGGFYNQSVGFTPKSITAAGGRLHTLSMTLGADGQNTVQLRGTEDGEVWEKAWRHQVFDGLHLPAVYAWIDLGGKSLHVGGISLLAHAI